MTSTLRVELGERLSGLVFGAEGDAMTQFRGTFAKVVYEDTGHRREICQRTFDLEVRRPDTAWEVAAQFFANWKASRVGWITPIGWSLWNSAREGERKRQSVGGEAR